MILVTVNKEALDAFIVYADSERQAADSQSVCSTSEYEGSEARFAELVGALSITPVPESAKSDSGS